LAKGFGLLECQVGLTFGIVKAPYITRVGNGPFPTEFGGRLSDKWCAKASRDREEKEFRRVSVNSKSPFRRGIAIRREGDEYGATTGRPRRCGRFDLPALRHAVQFGRCELVFTKSDVLDEMDEIEVCTTYRYNGPDYWHAGHLYRKGDRISTAIPDRHILEHCKPVYRKFKGWRKRTRQIRRYTSLPKRLRNILEFISEETGCQTRSVSVGPDREHTVWV